MASVTREFDAIPVPDDVRLIASDLDGTLLLPDGSVGARTRQALDELRDSDIDLVIVTGRPPRWIAPIVDMTGHRGIGIGANGGVVLDLANGEVLEVFALAAQVAAEAIDRLRHALPGVVFAVERARPGARLASTAGAAYDRLDSLPADPTEFALGDGYRPRWPVPADTHIAPIEELVAQGDVVKILVRPGDDVTFDNDVFLTVGDEALSGLVEVTHSDPTDRLLEISALGVSKATTLARVAAIDGHGPSHVISAGDAPNDLPMLFWAETSYAVANAHPAVLSAATHHVPANSQEGVAQLIESVLHRNASGRNSRGT
ncbi:MAG: HAD family hydrolase [Candidatus Nanopelagicales bacterium]